jgi:hypothetical protein
MIDKLESMSDWLRYVGFLVMVIGLVVSVQRTAQAQFEKRWLAAGEMRSSYLASAHEQENWQSGNGLQWPAIEPQRGINRGNGLWIAAKNFTDERGDNYPVKAVHVGPRSAGVGEVFAQEFELYNRFPMPRVTVDGLETFAVAQKPDEIRPEMKADQMLHTETTTQVGIRIERNIYQFSQEHHDNYHIREYILTNTGNVDTDPDQELDEPLEDVRVLFQDRPQMTPSAGDYYPGSAWGGENNMKDVVNDGMHDYDTPVTEGGQGNPPFDNHAYYIWPGNSPNADIDPLGGPVRENWPWYLQEGDTVGRLRENWFQGRVTLESTEPSEYPVPEHEGMENHPTTTAYFGQDHPLTGASDPYDKARMQREYELMMAHGHGPHAADVVDQDGDFSTPDGDPALQPLDGVVQMTGYGPYQLDVGESIRIVHGVGVDGISIQAAYHIGKKWKATDWAATAPITHTVHGEEQSMTKGRWVMTGRDSLTDMFHATIKAWENEMEIPRPPLPPNSFNVTSGVDAIELDWTTFSNSNAQAHEIYRTENHVEGNINSIFEYEKVAEVGPGSGSYRDEEVQRGTEYYYYIQAVGSDRPADEETMTPAGPLRSSRYWTQTYASATLKRQPGDLLSDARVVPNPLNMASEESVRFSGQENRIGFMDIPGNCTIQIFSSLGELVKTIEHTDGSGDEFWNLTTRNRQIVASGIYVAVITDNRTGRQVERNFTIVR